MNTIFTTSKGSSQVWKVTKSFRNETKIHRMLVTVDSGDEDHFESYANDMAHEWAEADGSGQNYGYRYSVELETDTSEINKMIESECKSAVHTLSFAIINANYLIEIVNNHEVDVEKSDIDFLVQNINKLKS